jgi:DnaJ like chaperone protein
MQWFGKAIGGIIGLATGGPFGSLVGILVGHQWDQSASLFRRGGHGAARISALFFAVTFEVMGQIAKVDGRVSEGEVRVARGIMHGMQLSAGQVRTAIEHFTRGKSATYPLAERLEELSEQIAIGPIWHVHSCRSSCSLRWVRVSSAPTSASCCGAWRARCA